MEDKDESSNKDFIGLNVKKLWKRELVNITGYEPGSEKFKQKDKQDIEEVDEEIMRAERVTAVTGKKEDGIEAERARMRGRKKLKRA